MTLPRAVDAKDILSDAILTSIEERSTPEPNSGCHLWLGSDRNGYPFIQVRGRRIRLNRLILSKKIGRPLTKRELALHSCDVRCCINEAHIHVGDNNQNMKELWERDPPDRRGHNNGNSVLTVDDVIEIRKSSSSLLALSRRFGVSKDQIRNVINHKCWKHV